MNHPSYYRNIANGIESIRKAGNWAAANLKGEANESMGYDHRLKKHAECYDPRMERLSREYTMKAKSFKNLKFI